MDMPPTSFVFAEPQVSDEAGDMFPSASCAASTWSGPALEQDRVAIP